MALIVLLASLQYALQRFHLHSGRRPRLRIPPRTAPGGDQSEELRVVGDGSSRRLRWDVPVSEGGGELQRRGDVPRWTLVSADNRRPRFGSPTPGVPDATPDDATFYEWAALINVAYAERHGYDYRYFAYTDGGGDGCAHHEFGPRHVAWCKLLAVKAAWDRVALRPGVEWVEVHAGPTPSLLWLDSDAAWVRFDLSVESYLDQTGLGCSAYGYGTKPGINETTPPEKYRGCRTARCARLKDTASILFFANRPSCGEPAMTGTFVLRGTYNGLRSLSRWWNTDACARDFPWEQRAANYVLYPKLNGQTDGSGVEVLSTSHNFMRGPTEAVRHHGHFDPSGDLGRARKFREYFRSVGLDEEKDFARLAAKLREHIVDVNSEKLSRLSASLTSATWNKEQGRPDESWVSQNYSSDEPAWKRCEFRLFVRPPY